MIFAAGLGTRLRPLTDTRPKALVEVAGVTLLERVIRKVAAAGITEIVVNTHHFAAMIEEFLRSREWPGLDIAISPEPDGPLDTGGALKRAAPLLAGADAILVHNVDILSDADLGGLLEAHLSRCAAPGKSEPEGRPLATLLVNSRDTSRRLVFDSDDRLVAWTDLATGAVKPVVPCANTPGFAHQTEKNSAPCAKQGHFAHDSRALSFAGIHVCSPEALELMAGWPDRFSIIDFWLQSAATRPVLCHEVPELQLIDVGNPERLAAAERDSRTSVAELASLGSGSRFACPE